jgi:hypothetical protein
VVIRKGIDDIRKKVGHSVKSEDEMKGRCGDRTTKALWNRKQTLIGEVSEGG